jgi:uncharacterized protein (DUF58 family)
MSPEASAARNELSRFREAGERLADRLPSLMVEADRVATTVAQGVHGRRRTGTGETFWQFRLYQSGDDAADIDWRQSARSRHLFVREQEWEAAASVWLWCDLSPSMAFRSARGLPSKRERALVLCLALATLLVRGGERVALLGSGERPRTGRTAISHLARALGAADREAATQIPEATLPRHARLVLASDFLQPLPGIEPRLGHYVGAGTRGCLIQVCDPAEELLPYDGRVLFEGMEQDGRQLIGNVEVVRARYRAAYHAHREMLGQLCTRQGWRFTAHRTDGSAEAGLLSLYQMLAPRLGP